MIPATTCSVRTRRAVHFFVCDWLSGTVHITRVTARGPVTSTFVPRVLADAHYARLAARAAKVGAL